MKSGEFRSYISTRMVRDLIFGGVEHHTWSYLRGEGTFSVDGTANSIADMVYRGMAAQADPASIPLEQVLQRLEAVAGIISPETSAAPKVAATAGKAKRAAKPARDASPRR
jgi:hypothetical protein